jgi:hypothetical protein
MLFLEYAFFLLEPQLREEARLDELRKIEARKLQDSSPSLAMIAAEEKSASRKGVSADEPQIDPPMLKKIEQVFSFRFCYFLLLIRWCTFVRPTDLGFVSHCSFHERNSREAKM